MSSPQPTGVEGVTQRFATAADVPVLLAKIAVELGCGGMEWSVLDWNEPAIGFHRKPARRRWTSGPSSASRAQLSRASRGSVAPARSLMTGQLMGGDHEKARALGV